ncbi:MAG TPA: carbohydrate kinase family protein, partial [Candidatus Gracilibacteria bacterium]|nr:carbohydrate kinase family protein [Candidatus Gracilibacteria bacterium]
NIAYNLRLLGEMPVLMTVVGSDFEPYRARLLELGCNVEHVYASDKALTASAFIVTDREENQITIFEPGAMFTIDTSQSVKDAGAGTLAWAIISPDRPERMVKLSLECAESGVPYVFDPAQQIPNFQNPDLMKALSGAAVVIANEYESALLSKKLGVTPEELSAMVPTFIETHGSKGCSIKSPEGMFFVRAVQPAQIADPTGCGDAFRAGVLMGLRRGFAIQKSCMVGALIATYSLEQPGTQNHRFTMDEFGARFENNFGETL